VQGVAAFRLLLVVAVLAAAVAVPASTSAKAKHQRHGWGQIIRDCADDGKLDHHYKRERLRKALHHIPTDIDEYTDCRAVIRLALCSAAGHHKHHHKHHHHSDGSGGAVSRPSGGSDCGNHSHKPQKPKRPTLYALGEAPISASVLRPWGPSKTQAWATIDQDARTAFTTKQNDIGVQVEPSVGEWRAIAVITETPGWSLAVYYSNATSPGGVHSDDWRQAVSMDPVARRTKLSVPNAKHYLAWVADANGKRVRINEIQLFQ
jgi:hypothetical protein